MFQILVAVRTYAGKMLQIAARIVRSPTTIALAGPAGVLCITGTANGSRTAVDGDMATWSSSNGTDGRRNNNNAASAI